MKLISLLAVIIFPLFLSAQKNFQQGHIVTKGGDTLKGFIDFREWNTNPEKVRFAPASGGEGATEYDATTIRSFEVQGKEAYEGHPVKISLDPVRLTDLRGRDTSAKIGTVFLKVLYKGKSISLYAYTDQVKRRYYIFQHGAAGPEELVYREFYRGESENDYNTDVVVKEKGFIDQLKKIMFGRNLYTGQLGSRIESAAYEETALKAIVYRLDGLDRQEQKKIKEKQPSSLRFFAGAGLQQNKLSVKGDHLFANGARSSSAILPRIGAGADLLVNPHAGKLLFRLEAGYQINRSKITTPRPSYNVQSTYELSMSTISLYQQVIFNIYNSPVLKIPVGGGIGYNLASYSRNYYSEVDGRTGRKNWEDEDYFDMRKVYRAVLARAGIVFRDRVEATFLYYPSRSITNYVHYSVKSSDFQFQVNYLFHRSKQK